MTKLVIYLAGPMRGIAEYNFPAFHKAAAQIRARGHEVWSPAERDEADGFDPKRDEAEPFIHYMRLDLPEVLRCDAVAVLPGWQDSQGARLEVHVATECGLPILDAETLEPWHESVLGEADRIVGGVRSADYGHPLDDFIRTGRFWGATLDDPTCPECGHSFDHPDVSAEEVSLCMVGVKISREVNHPKRDNRVDGPGYFKCLDMVHDERERRATSPRSPGIIKRAILELDAARRSHIG